MIKLDIFSIEELIFNNPKAKQVLWKDYDSFFKEYIFIKQASLDQALLSNLYIKFLKVFSKNKQKDEILHKIFPSTKIILKYNFKSTIFNINLSIKDIKVNKYNKLNKDIKVNKQQDLYKQQQLYNDDNINKYNISDILRIYPNISATRNKNEMKVTFWK